MDPVFWSQPHHWIRFACACGYTQETIYTGNPVDAAKSCGLCGATVVGDVFDLHAQTKAA